MMLRGLLGGSYKPLDDDAVGQIHRAVMRVMGEIGFEANSSHALEVFAESGARVDADERRVYLPEEMVMKLISQAPSQITLCGQEERHDIEMGGARVYAGTGGTALYVYDARSGEKRKATLNNLKDIARLVDQLDNIHLFMLPTYPSELPIEQVDVNRFFTGLDNSTKHIMGGVYTIDGVKSVVRMAEMVAGSPEALRERPLVSMVACSISPMKLDGQYGDLVITIAREGVPLVCPAEPLCGATSPVTLASNLVIQIVDSLMGVVLAQIVNPGTPVILGSVASSTDFRNLGYLAGSVEMGLINAAGAQMAQFYGLPFYATGGMTDSKVLDAQCGYESAISGLLCALAGANFIHDAAGLMEFAMTMSYEKLVIDNEILGMVMRAVSGIKVNEDTIAYDLIRQAGPGGNFVSAKHTRQFMRHEHYQPQLSNRDKRADWEETGGLDTSQRASDEVARLLANPTYCLPEPVRSRILAEVTGIVDVVA
jgi:trimethylamine--corrinoid protein Co-methyltransferase